MTIVTQRAAIAVLLGLFTLGTAATVRADIEDYEFRLIQTDIKQGDSAVVVVQLLDKRTGKVVPDAVIFASRIDMTPDGMPTMTAPIEPMPPTAPGIYRFKTNLTMAGGWQLSVAAKIQGETETLENKLVLKVMP